MSTYIALESLRLPKDEEATQKLLALAQEYVSDQNDFEPEKYYAGKILLMLLSSKQLEFGTAKERLAAEELSPDLSETFDELPLVEAWLMVAQLTQFQEAADLFCEFNVENKGVIAALPELAELANEALIQAKNKLHAQKSQTPMEMKERAYYRARVLYELLDQAAKGTRHFDLETSELNLLNLDDPDVNNLGIDIEVMYDEFHAAWEVFAGCCQTDTYRGAVDIYLTSI